MTIHLQAIVFDLDGTLLTIDQRFHRVFNDTAEELGGRKISAKDFSRKFHNDELYYHPFGSSRKNTAKTRSFWSLFLKSYGKEAYTCYSTSIRGTKQTVTQIRRKGIRIAVTTGRMCRARTVRHELRNIGIDQCVDVTITKATALRFKNPHHATSRSAELREVLKRLRVGAHECVFVADYVDDIRSAKRLGISTIAVLSGSSSFGLLKREDPDHIIKSIRDLPRLLETEFFVGHGKQGKRFYRATSSH
jgi:phosphoglycolate phosphatase-like HAD superfamily hydrolase